MSASCTSPGSLASNPPARRGAPGDDQVGDPLGAGKRPSEEVWVNQHPHGRLHVDLHRTASMACPAAPSLG